MTLTREQIEQLKKLIGANPPTVRTLCRFGFGSRSEYTSRLSALCDMALRAIEYEDSIMRGDLVIMAQDNSSRSASHEKMLTYPMKLEAK